MDRAYSLPTLHAAGTTTVQTIAWNRVFLPQVLGGSNVCPKVHVRVT